MAHFHPAARGRRAASSLIFASSLLVALAAPASSRAEMAGLTDLSVGSEHACALTAAGGVRCWGQAMKGQLGSGITGGILWGRGLPVTPQGLDSGVTAVSAGSGHTCALMVSGTVKCWGDNAYGQLGTGDQTNSPVPVDVPGLSGVTAITAGATHTCAVVAGGNLKCWGDNLHGQLGNGTNARSLVPAEVPSLAGSVSQVSAGDLHTCALTSGGGAKCWGQNDYGQLGDGTKTARNLPTEVSDLASGVTSISASSRTTCATVAPGGARCWGYNRFNELGDGADTTNVDNWFRTTPVDVVGLSSGVAEVVAGGVHGCARLLDGTVKCWGENQLHGEVGDGTYERRPTPVTVAGLAGATRLQAGYQHNCALVSGGSVRCWGKNGTGQAGGALARGSQPGPSVGVPDYLLAPGISHNLFVSSRGELWAWGDNTAGKLGNGTTADTSIPVRVTGLSGVVGASAGMGHSLALKADGTVWAWGLNSDGQLGIGASSPDGCVIPGEFGPNPDDSFPCALAPVQVTGLDDVIAVSAGWRHSLALRKDGTVWRWGNDNLGAVGPASSILAPEEVVGGFSSSAVRIAAGYMHSVVLKSDGKVYAWGRAELGELGSSTDVSTGTPVDLAQTDLLFANDIAAGGGYTLARVGTSLKAWGSNVYGALGDATVDTGGGSGFRQAPAPVPGMTDVSAFTTGFGFAAARNRDGTVWSWGLNNRGQLGNGGAAPDFCGQASNLPCVRTPANVAAHDGAVVLAAGGAHALAVRPDGTVVAFGDNLVGQHGNRGGNFGTGDFTQIIYDPDFTRTPGGTFGTPTGIGTDSTTGSLKTSTIGDGIAFGSQAVSTPTSPVDVVLTNLSGSGSITISAVETSPPGEFAVTANGCAGTLAADASCTMTLVFIPAAPGARSGSLTITSDAANAGTITLALSGIGIDARVASTVALVASAASSASGTQVTFTATVGAGATTPTGTVAFKDGGAAIAGCASVTLAAGSAACTTSALAVGGHSIAAEYSGDGAVQPSASALLGHTVFLPRVLSVQATGGTGSGSVTSLPAGIDCGATCSAAFTDGATVILSATPATGSLFAGWSGEGCSGTGSCQVTMSAARTVTATFDLAPTGPLSANPASLDFGGQSMGTTSPARALTLTNTTGSAMTVSAASTSTWFAVTHDCAALAAGASCTANVTFTPTAQGSLNGTLTVASSAGNTTVPLAGTGERSLVTHYYRSILRRAPDTGGKGFWEAEAARVQALGLNVNEVWFAMAGSFFASAEYLALGRDDAGFVTDLYNTFFNRPPDGPGLAFWTGELAGGLPREVALVSFMFSTEFVDFTQAIFGTTAVRAEIDAVTDFFRGLLGRLPDDGGFAFWVGQFRTAQCAGGAAVNTQVESISSLFALSAEYASRGRTNAQYAGDLYNAFLRRGGDRAGVLFWINEIASGARTRENVRQAFVASPEFQARVAAIIAAGCVP